VPPGLHPALQKRGETVPRLRGELRGALLASRRATTIAPCHRVVRPDVAALVAAICAPHSRPIGDPSEASRARIAERTWDRLRPAYLEVLGFVAGGTPLVTPFPTFTPVEA
jgi:hypothetical protein